MSYWHLLFTVVLFYQCSAHQGSYSKLKLLILSGSNNHEWQATTDYIQSVYTTSGRFTAEITENPDTLTYEVFKRYDAVVSNWNSWPENTRRWPVATETGLMKFIDEGGGFALFHAANAAFYDWEDYQKLVGSTWGDSTRHGKIMPFKVSIKDQTHPVTAGIADFWITDELWVHSATQPDIHILAEAYSDTSNSGRGMMEPVVLFNTRGRGRVFHNILGHNERAMKNTGWKTLMLRGTEWAATGKVTIPVPVELALENPSKTHDLSWHETDTTLALKRGETFLWQYNYNTQKGKPFFHPITIDGTPVTWLSPDDHPWHLGLWHSWKYINGVNYWEYDQSPGVAQWNYSGITELREIRIQKSDDFSCRLMLTMAYHEKGGDDLINEHCTITVSAPDEKDLLSIDYAFEWTALTDSVILNRTPLPNEPDGKDWGGYAGLSVRFSPDFFNPHFINSDGSTEMKHGAPMAWKYYELNALHGKETGLAIFDAPSNLNHPTPWFVTNSEDHPFYYFSPSPIFYKPHTMKTGEKLELRYRVKCYSGETTFQQLEQDYSDFKK